MNIIKLKPERIFHTNNYLFNYRNKVNLIDAGFQDIAQLMEEIKQFDWKLDNLLITHGHFDHIAGIELIIDKFPDINCYINENELEFLSNSEYNVSGYFDREFIVQEKYLKRFKTFKDWDIIDWIHIIHTPGHTIWWSCFYIPEEHICFSWDTIFANWYWRHDLITWDLFELQRSLDKIYKLPWKTIIHSGHWPKWILEKMGIIY